MKRFNEVTIKVAGHDHHVTGGLIFGKQIRSLANVPEDHQILLELKHELDLPVLDTDAVVVEGGEEFSVGKKGQHLPDDPPVTPPLKIIINKQEFASGHRKLTGQQIKELAKAEIAGNLVYIDIPHLADEQLGDAVRLILKHHPEFIIAPCGNVGLGGLEHQLAVLKDKYPNVEVTAEGTNLLLVIKNMTIPDGWSSKTIDLLIIVPNTYPMAALDMFWVAPTLTLANGGIPQCASEMETYGGRRWQRFSWHLSRSWNPQLETLESYVKFCMTRLQQLN